MSEIYMVEKIIKGFTVEIELSPDDQIMDIEFFRLQVNKQDRYLRFLIFRPNQEASIQQTKSFLVIYLDPLKCSATLPELDKNLKLTPVKTIKTKYEGNYFVFMITNQSEYNTHTNRQPGPQDYCIIEKFVKN